MPADPSRGRDVFLAALERSPEQRPGFLAEACRGDADLRAEVDRLLIANADPDSILEPPSPTPVDATAAFVAGHPGTVELPGSTSATDAFDPHAPSPKEMATEDRGPDEATEAFAQTEPDSTTAAASASPAHRADRVPTGEGIGTVIAGRYTLVEVIGEGGMGSVYLASQTEPVKRQVALKLIKTGMDSRGVLARFDAERQALALMDHPNIAKVLDAGTTDAGRPFFVMELVKGIQVTDYCDQHRLGLTERLALFRQICSAVQHAHQKGIIHRDLKPSNILVESHDGRPVPKVIDFGLAKATSGLQLTEQSLYSAFGTVAGTPLYMAPEQASFDAIDVDTRADIYALGVILYELLTGSTPIQRDTFKRAALDEMLRVIREVEPPTPSSRISSSETLASVAASRHTEPARLSRFVRGDLDWVVMKALSKERQRRYESPIAFADDVERFLNHEPVTAGPPTAAYRFRKFVRRNRPQVVAASLVLLTLVGGIIGTTLGLFEARRQRGLAETRLEMTRKSLVQVEKANEILGSVFENLNERDLGKEEKPLVARLGERLDQATAQIEGDVIGDPLAVARMQRTLGRSQLGLGYPEKAIALLTKARATFSMSLGPGHFDTLASMNNLANGYQDAGRFDLAVPLYEETLALTKAKLGPGHHSTLLSMGALARGYQAAGRLDRAVPLYEETLALEKAELGPDHPDTLIGMGNLAGGYRAAGRLDRAVPLLEETLALTKAKLGPDHPNTLASMNSLASGYWSAGRLDGSIPLFEEALKLRAARSGNDHPETWIVRANLGVNYRDAGRLGEALPLLEGAVRASRQHPKLRWVKASLRDAYFRAGQAEKATALAREVLAEDRAALPPGSRELAALLAQTGLILLQVKSWTEAEPLLRECLAIREKSVPDLWSTYNARSMLGGALLGQKKYADAEPLLRAGYDGMKQRADKIPLTFKARLAEALDRLIDLSTATNKPDDVKTWQAERAKYPAAAPMPGEKK